MNNQSSRFNIVCGEKDGNVEQKSSNMKVVVRVRPPNERELSQGKLNVIRVIDDYMLTFDPKEGDLSQICNQKTRISVLDKRIRDLNFAFDRVFNDKATNEEVFEHTTKPAVESVLDGFNCSVFAYGATSAGKTHTMLGSPNKPGVIFLTMMELYRKLMEKDKEYETDLSVSYLEIYNETCKDLLLPTGALAVREDPDKGVCVAGLSLHKPRSAEELLEMLHFGNQNRTQHPTDANKQSSRSHAVFQVFIRQCPKVSGISTKVKLSKISLIDLAGSERATVTTNRGDRLREGANINKSLLALGNCINALAENKSNLHIPYRNSKLTRLLKDSLGGNCHTIMIAALSPSTLSYEDTYNTLKYANRAKNIKSSITANTMNVDYHISHYAKIVEDLRTQISVLQEKCQAPSPLPNKEDEKADQDYCQLERYSQNLKRLFEEKCFFLEQMVDCAASEKELNLKLLYKERSYRRLKIIHGLSGEDIENAHKKMEKSRMRTTFKQSKYNEQSVRLKGSLVENKQQIISLQAEIDEWCNSRSTVIRNSVNVLYELLQTEVERRKLNTKYKHVKRHFNLQDTDQRNNERLISQLLEIIATQQQKINSYRSPAKVNTPGLLNGLQELPKCLLAGPKISWADQTVSSGKEEEEQRNSTYFLDFTSYSPIKTPFSKKPVLRQVVMETKNGLDNTTDFNTTMNGGPIRFRLPLGEVDKNQNGISTSEDFNGTLGISESMVIGDCGRKECMVPSHTHKPEMESPVKETDKANVCRNHINDTPPPSNDVMKSFIPTKAPLTSTDGNAGGAFNLTAPRMRSLSEKFEKTCTIAEEKGLMKRDGHKPSLIRRSSFNKCLINKRRKMNLGGNASRSLSNLHNVRKENVRPPGGLFGQSNIGRFGTSKSMNSQNATKGRFRF